MDDSRPDRWLVLTGKSGSRRDQPSEFIDSRKDADAMFCGSLGTLRASKSEEREDESVAFRVYGVSRMTECWA